MATKKEPRLDPAWSARRAIRHIVRRFLAQLEAGERGVLATRDSVFVHRTRVALRRMRSALKLLGRTDEPASDLARKVTRVARALNDARDWDVMLEHTLPMLASGKPAGVGRIVREAHRRRRGAYARARKVLTSSRYRALKAELARWLDAPAVPGEASGTLRKFAARSIRKRYKRLLRDSPDLAGQTARRRHRVRIHGKHLRYTIEFFESLFGRAPARPHLRELVAIQDALGALNDGVTAARLLARLRPSAEFARFARKRLAAHEKTHAAAAQAAFARLRGCERFWKSKS